MRVLAASLLHSGRLRPLRDLFFDFCGVLGVRGQSEVLSVGFSRAVAVSQLFVRLAEFQERFGRAWIPLRRPQVTPRGRAEVALLEIEIAGQEFLRGLQ